MPVRPPAAPYALTAPEIARVAAQFRVTATQARAASVPATPSPTSPVRDPLTCPDARRDVSPRTPGAHVTPIPERPGDVLFEQVAADGRVLGRGVLAAIMVPPAIVTAMTVAAKQGSDALARQCAACGACRYGVTPITRRGLRLEA